MLLKDLCTVVSNYYQSNDHWPEFYYLDTGSLTNNCISEIQNFKTVHDLPSRAKQKVSPGNILYSSVRPNQRHYGYIDKAYKHLLVSTGFIVLSPNESLVNGKFLYYALTQPWVTEKLQSIAQNNTSAYPAISAENLLDIDINLPSRETQDKIVDILSGIDNQIERNNDMVKKLQVLAHTTYQRWFEQFEFPNEHGKPYKSSGGKMVWNDELKREIPVGWDVCTLSDLLCKQQTKYTSMTAVPTIDLSVMPADCMALDEQNVSTNFTTNLYKMDAGDILFGSIRPYLHKAGIAPCDGAVAGTVHAYKPHIPSDYNLCACVLTHPTIFEFATNQAKGTKMPVVSSEDLLSKRIVYDATTSARFTQTLELATILHNCTNQNTRLKQLKASLLPLLMNGQLCV